MNTPRNAAGSAVEIRHFHLFAGLGGGARGFNRGTARVGQLQARFRCIGGVDVDPAAMRDFERLAGVRGTVLDLFDREQYLAFNEHEPPADWREATPQDIQRAAGGERPHIVFLSAPCKGFSGLLSEAKSKTHRYQALNRLTLRGVFLMLEAWADDPPELVLFENVPRLATRGRALLDQITALLRSYGYATAETTHDCGELGGLAQSRKRFLLVARHTDKVPPLLYVPSHKPLRAVGDVLGRMPLPGDERGGPMHRMPALQWRTWVRLAFVEAGSDWRSLNRLQVADGKLRDFLIVPTMHRGGYGVRRWDESTGVVAGESRSSNGAFSVADPRFDQSRLWNDGQAFGVRKWSEPTGAIAGQQTPGQGAYCVADPRTGGVRHNNVFRVVRYVDPSASVTGGTGPSAGGLAVADPRGDACPTADDGADGPSMPDAADKLVARIAALDGTWHRPFTTLELAALQSLIEPEEHLELDGLSDSAWRERIGNAVPSDAAQAIASEMGRTLLGAWSGETFALSSAPVWVRPVVVGLSVAQAGAAA